MSPLAADGMGNLFARPNATIPTVARPDATIPTGVPVAVAESVSTAADVTAMPQLQLHVTAEKGAVAACAERMLAMCSIKAPPALDDVKRPPIDLVACIDRSGSMHGEKMSLMKKTLELLVKRAGLKGDDRISLVTFDSNIRLDIPLTSMDESGRNKADDVIKGLRPGSTTNLSGGALQAIEVLERSGASNEGRTRAVMLFTDGMANEGLRDPAQLTRAVAGAIATASAKCGGPISLYTFGFGADHNEACLRNLATGSGSSGLYYYIKTPDDIPTAFADALGGLTSVVAQNVKLSLEAVGTGVSVKRVLGSTYTRDAEGSVVLGDLFAEDEKDVLVELQLPKLRAPQTDPPPLVLNATLRGFNVPRSAPDNVAVSLAVARPASEPAEQPVNTALDEQRNRIMVAEAMEEATRLADAGNVAAGRAELERIHRVVALSPSGGTDLSNMLKAQCVELQGHYADASNYRMVGSKMSRMHARSHQVQRSTHMSPEAYTSGAKRKAALKSSWASSFKSGINENDSDSD